MSLQRVDFAARPAVDGRGHVVCHLEIVDKEKSLHQAGREPTRTILWNLREFDGFISGSEAGLVRRAAGEVRFKRWRLERTGRRERVVIPLPGKSRHLRERGNRVFNWNSGSGSRHPTSLAGNWQICV